MHNKLLIIPDAPDEIIKLIRMCYISHIYANVFVRNVEMRRLQNQYIEERQ